MAGRHAAKAPPSEPGPTPGPPARVPKPAPGPSLPPARGHQWLLRRVLAAGPFGGQLRHLLANDAELREFLKASPKARRLLNQLCRGLGIDLAAECPIPPIEARGAAPARPRPAPAASPPKAHPGPAPIPAPIPAPEAAAPPGPQVVFSSL